jgi:O-antigen/teichoic acid export membrane protein
MSGDVIGEAPSQASSPAHSAAIRGSSLLLFGRLLAIAAGLVIQVLIVRNLSQAQFGAFAYCIAVANLVTVLVSLGMEQTMSRFAAIYDETDQQGRLSGAILFFLIVVATLGALVVTAAVLGREELRRAVIHDEQTAELMAIMIVLGPLQALDTLGSTLFAVFARPRAIFWRRYMLGPALRIGVVALVLSLDGSVFMLGAGYVVASALGLLLYLPPLLLTLRRRGVFAPGVQIVFPIRELFRFTATGVGADLLVITLFASDAIIVGRIAGPTDVALFQSVQPLANGNLVVFYALVPLFIPMASRMFVTGASERARELYATCSLWIAVFTFPVAALTICCAGPVVEAFFGQRYAPAAPMLALLSLSQYLLAVFGLSTLTLKAYGSLRNLALANIVASVLNVSVNIVLVREYGALGAAFGTMAATTLLTVAKCIVMRRELGIWPVERKNLTVLLRVLALGLAVAAIDVTAHPPLVGEFLLVALLSVLLVRTSRRELAVLEVFPEARRIAPLRMLIG